MPSPSPSTSTSTSTLTPTPESETSVRTVPTLSSTPPRIGISILPKDKVPTFPVGVKGVWELDGTLNDIVGTNNFAPSSGSATYTQFSRYELIPNSIVTRNGALFEENKFYSASNSYSYGNDWTVAFWWNSPELVGFTRHVTTRELEPKIAPIFAIGDSAQINSITVLYNTTLILTEIGYSKTQNAIRAYLTTNGSVVSHIITSEPYTAGLHHILVTYVEDQGRFRIDIDGKTGVMHSAPTVSLQRIGKLRINDIVPGPIAYKTIQTGGYLFDLVFTTYAASDNESLKAFRYGYEHISHDNLFDARFAYFGIGYSQPSTVSTTQIFVDGGNIFAARSNGKIVKGARPVWDKEFSYPNTQSVALLNVSQTDDDRTITWTPGGLRLKGVSIRI